MENKDVSSWYKVKCCTKKFMKIMWKQYPKYYLIYLVHILVEASAPFINIIFPRYIIDELMGNQNLKKIVVYIALTVGLNYLVNVFQHIFNMLKDIYSDSMQKYVARQISEKAMRISYQCTENRTVLEQMEKARTGMSWYSGGISGIMDEICNIIMSILQLTGVCLLIINKVPLVLVVYAVSIVLDTIITKLLNKIELDYFIKLSKSNRIFKYVFWELQEIRFSKDIRLYGAQDIMEYKATYYGQDMVDQWVSRANQGRKYQLFTSVLFAIRSTVVVFLIAIKTLRKKISVGEFYTLYYAGNTLHDSIRNAITGVQSIFKKSSYAYEYLLFMEYPDEAFNGTRKVETSSFHKIEFRNVSFHYPENDSMVLKNINATIKQGDHISVVGLNGAGKTTFIKLLCRLYDPTDGCILIDGVDIREYDYEEYVKLISVVFQDFQIYAFTVLENIMLSDTKPIVCSQKQMERITESFSWKERRKFEMELSSVTSSSLDTLSDLTVLQDNKETADVEKYQILSKVMKQVGLEDMINRLTYGVNTFVSQHYEEEGVELSGGQKQKIAIARALYKNTPIVILDEPTAALDPIAEYEIYKQFNSLVENRTAIYISHRLSSCQFSDIIYVFEQGSIKEVGTHKELVNRPDGLYAKMFQAQAQYYNKK